MAENTDDVPSHSSFLFSDHNCHPIQFFIRPSATRAELKPLIESGGGEVTSRLDKASDKAIKILAEGDECLADDYVSHTYITDCVAANTLLQLENYRVKKSNQQKVTPCNVVLVADSGKGRSYYTSEEDEAILQHIAKHPDSYRGNQVWKKMELMKITKHSWQSMRDHFLKKLEHRLKKYMKERRERLKVKKLASSGVDRKAVEQTGSDSDVEIKDFSDGNSDKDGVSNARRNLLAVIQADGQESDGSSLDVNLCHAAEESGKQNKTTDNSRRQLRSTSNSTTATTSTRSEKVSDNASSSVAHSHNTRSRRHDKEDALDGDKKKNSAKGGGGVNKSKAPHDDAVVPVHNTRSQHRRNKETESSTAARNSPLRKNERAEDTRRSGKQKRSEDIEREEEMEDVEGKEEEEEMEVDDDDETQIDPEDSDDDEEVTFSPRRAIGTRNSQQRKESPIHLELVHFTPNKKRKRTPTKQAATPDKASRTTESPMVLRKSKKDIETATTDDAQKDSSDESTSSSSSSSLSAAKPSKVARSSRVSRRNARKETAMKSRIEELEEEEKVEEGEEEEGEPRRNGGDDKVGTSTGGEEADSESSPARRIITRNRQRVNCIVAESDTASTNSDVIPMKRMRKRGLPTVTTDTDEISIPETQEFRVTGGSGDATNEKVVIPETQEFEVTNEETSRNGASGCRDEEIPDTQVSEMEVNEEEVEECRQIVKDLSKQFKLPMEKVCTALYMNSGDVAETQAYLTNGKRTSGYLWTKSEDDKLLSPSASTVRAMQRKYGKSEVAKRLKFLAS